jgi:hypothetical protein
MNSQLEQAAIDYVREKNDATLKALENAVTYHVRDCDVYTAARLQGINSKRGDRNPYNWDTHVVEAHGWNDGHKTVLALADEQS